MSNGNTLRHLAIIMDGNGRWAKAKGLRRTKGHEKGAEVIRDITRFCADHDEIESVTFYAFSTENWKRPQSEVNFLMRLLERYLKNETSTYMEHGIRFLAIGDTSAFSPALRERIRQTEEMTKENTRLTQILALNYGGRAEIVHAVNRLINEGSPVNEENLSSALQTPYSDIDLLIRTSGEERISNFLLWQISYAELYFTPTYWPDFTPGELNTIIDIYKKRIRRFGGI